MMGQCPLLTEEILESMKIGKWVISFQRDDIDLDSVIKEARAQAFQDALEILEKERLYQDRVFARESLERNFTSFGKINMLANCMSYIRSKRDGKKFYQL